MNSATQIGAHSVLSVQYIIVILLNGMLEPEELTEVLLDDISDTVDLTAVVNDSKELRLSTVIILLVRYVIVRIIAPTRDTTTIMLRIVLVKRIDMILSKLSSA